MNNKGQTLVLFIILLPVILIFLALIINLGSTSIQKRKLDIIVKNIVEDNMDNLNDTNITEQIDLMLKNNIDKFEERNIIITSDSLKVSVTIKLNNIFGNILNNEENIYQISYKGTIDNNKVKIVRRG